MNLYRMLAWPVLRRIEAEAAHRLSVLALKYMPMPYIAPESDPALAITLFGQALAHPVGLAAGYDKHAEVPDALLGLGFSFVECGSITPQPQPGNPKPRLFRLEEDEAVINRFGFNSEGMEAAASRLRARFGQPGLVGGNIGANKDSADRPGDYAQGYKRLAALCGYCVVNVSSPNTPGLRNLQGRDELGALLERIQPLRAEIATPLLVKISPDMAPDDLEAIADLALRFRLDGIIATNTTLERPATLKSPAKAEAGGLSGTPLLGLSNATVARLYRRLGKAMPIIGVGGIASGADAYAKIRAGASAVQVYSALVYEGPGLVARIRRELAALIKQDGLGNVAEAVGLDAGKY